MVNKGFVNEQEEAEEKIMNAPLDPGVIFSKDKEKIVSLAKASNAILFQATTVFPFNFFPDTITIDKTKITINERIFFFSEYIRSFAIEDILNIEVGSNLFFSTLTCLTRYDNKKAFRLRFMKKSDAAFAKKIIQGLIIAKREGVHIDELTKEEIMTYGEVIGKGDREE